MAENATKTCGLGDIIFGGEAGKGFCDGNNRLERRMKVRKSHVYRALIF